MTLLVSKQSSSLHVIPVHACIHSETTSLPIDIDVCRLVLLQRSVKIIILEAHCCLFHSRVAQHGTAHPPCRSQQQLTDSPLQVRIIIKGGVWRNTEDEILKAAISKYGKNVSIPRLSDRRATTNDIP
jgi:hypothetical protein